MERTEKTENPLRVDKCLDMFMGESTASAGQQEALRQAKVCSWAGVACLFMVPILIVAGAHYQLNDESLGHLLGLPARVAGVLSLAFLVSWFLGFIGFFFRAGDWNLEAQATTLAKQQALVPIRRLRRWSLSVFLLAVLAQGMIPQARSWAPVLGMAQLPAALGMMGVMFLLHALNIWIWKCITRIWKEAAAMDVPRSPSST